MDKIKGLVRWVLPVVIAAATGCGTVATPLAATRSATLQAADRTPAVGVENFKKVNAKLYRGGLPTAAQFVALKKMGIRTDVSLLGAGQANQRQLVEEERTAAERAGLEFVNLVVPFQAPPRSLVERFLATVQDPANGPVYVHCKHGRDRTGAMIALYRIAVDGYSGEQALDEMESFGYEPERFPYYTKFVLGFSAN